MLRIEEGGFGKGVGLDAALRELALGGATRARLDLGGQIAVHGAESAPYACAIADPRERGRARLRLQLERGSLATSGNSERGLSIDGEPRGHLLDPRSGEPAADFGSLSVLAPTATGADCLSTGLYVLGPEAALAYGRASAEVDVLVLEPTRAGRLRARATGALAARLDVLDEAVELERLADLPPAPDAKASAAR
jgi:thiamine biosynthesis lipoprotein